jgi:hypothetical protein
VEALVEKKEGQEQEATGIFILGSANKEDPQGSAGLAASPMRSARLRAESNFLGPHLSCQARQPDEG